MSATNQTASLLDELTTDGRIALRALMRSPTTTAVAFATMTAAVALSTAVGSLVSTVLLRPLPYPQPERLVKLSESRPDRVLPTGAGRLQGPTIGQWLQEAKALEAIVPYSTTESKVTGGGEPAQLAIATVGDRFFELFGVRPVEGRLFVAADHDRSAPQVAVLSERYWTQAFGRRTDIVGQLIRVEEESYTVIGVAPDSIHFPAPNVSVWSPGRWRFPLPGGRGNIIMLIDVVARIREGSTVADVEREGQRVAFLVASADPYFMDGTVPVATVKVTPLVEEIIGSARPALTALFWAMGIVLLAACVSLANLLAARNTARAKDVAIRVTLGATRGRLLRALLMEHAVLAVTSVAIGTVAGWWILRALPAIAPTSLPRLQEARLDLLALGVAAVAMTITCLAAGIRPALRRLEIGLRDVPNAQRAAGLATSRSAEAVRSALVAAQVALAAVLLVAAGLLGRSLMQLLATDPGYQPGGVLTFQLGHAEAYREPARIHNLYRLLEERLRATPGVVAVGTSSRLPLHSRSFAGTFIIEGQPLPTDPAERPRGDTIVVSPDYLAAIGARVVEGRGFTRDDRADSQPVVLVDEEIARRHFGNEAVGRRITSIGRKTYTIVGVVRSMKMGAVSDPESASVYYANEQIAPVIAYPRLSGGVAVRTTVDPSSLIPAVRQFMRELDPTAPVFNSLPLDERFSRTFDTPRFYAIALVLFAAMTLVTAVLAVYGVQSDSVERRQSEFGVRRALGATERDIVRLVLRRAGLVALAGLAVGLLLAVLGGGLLRTMLFGIQPLDPVTFVGVAAGVVAVVLLATWQPMLRALRVDPAQALRAE